MKKIIGIALAALLCVGGFSLAEENKILTSSEVAQKEENTDLRLGFDAIGQIRKNYEAGKYDDFLKEMDTSYGQVKESGQLSEFASLREGVLVNPKWVESLKNLQKEKNGQLIQTVAEEDSLFSDKVRSAASMFSESQEQAITTIATFHQMLPETGKNNDENTLIELDLEYEYKAIHLGRPAQQEDVAIQEKHYALKMEQMNKMLLASQSFEDADLKQQVSVFGDLCDQRLAQNWDQMDLQALTQGKIKAANLMQERVVAVLLSHQEKMSDLASQF